MTILINSAEGGTNGANATSGNSGGASGNAFGTVTASVLYTNAQKSHGTLGYTASGSGTQYTRWDLTTGPVLMRGYFRWSDISQGATPLRLNMSSGSIFVALMNGGNAGKVQFYLTSGLATSPVIISAATWYRFEMYVNSTAGSARAAVYEGDDTTPLWDSNLINGLTLASPTQEIYGKFDSSSTYQVWWDSVGLKTAADAVWGAWPISNPAPVVTPVSAQSVAAGATVTVNISATDDGSIASYASSVLSAKSTASPTLSGASTATVTFTAPAAGNLVTGQTVVTDNLGATTTVEWEVRVPTSSTSFTTLNIPGVGGWTNAGGAANTGTALSDSSDATYVESPDYTVVESEFRQRLQPLSSRSSLQLTWRHVETATGGTVKARLYEGNTMRQEWTLTQSTTATDQALTVTSPGAISDWGNLWVAESVVS